MKLLPVFSYCFLFVAVTTTPLLVSAQKSDPVAGMERKLDHIESNATLAHPDPTPTTFTEAEINAYLASGAVQFPAGVRSARFEEQPGVVTANTRVDFDRLKAGTNSSNPLLSIFTGGHDVSVASHAACQGRQSIHRCRFRIAGRSRNSKIRAAIVCREVSASEISASGIRFTVRITGQD